MTAVLSGRLYWGGLGVLALVVAAGYWWRVEQPAPAGHRPGSLGNSGLPDQVEMQLVVIGSLTCHGADSPEFQTAVRKLQARARAEAEVTSVAVTVVGVGLDWAPSDGLKFFKRFGPFDMLLIGGNWLNEGAVKYIWRDLPGEPSVPQVLLVKRRIEVGGRMVVDSETVVWRLIGSDVVEQRANDSTPLLPAIARTPTPVVQ